MTGGKRFSTGKSVRFNYLNHKGEYRQRYVLVLDLMYGTHLFHAQPQWLLKCFDLDKLQYRTFALADIDTTDYNGGLTPRKD